MHVTLEVGVIRDLLMLSCIGLIQKSCNNSRICLMMDIHKFFNFFPTCRQICLTYLLIFSSTEMVSKI